MVRPRSRTLRGHFADMAVAGLRTVLRPSVRTCRVRGCDRGLDADTDCPWPVCGQRVDKDADIQAGHGADIPHPFRDHFADIKSFAGEGVGLACEKIVLNMDGNGLLLLLKNFFPPAFQLRGNGLNPGGLLNGS